MSSQKLQKRGSLERKPSGNSLKNDKGEVFEVSDSAVEIWDSFRNKSVDEVANDYSLKVNRTREELAADIGLVAFQLKNVDLLGS